MNGDYTNKAIRVPAVLIASVLVTVIFIVVLLMVGLESALGALGVAGLIVAFQILASIVPVPALSRAQSRWVRFFLVTLAMAALFALLYLDFSGDFEWAFKVAALGVYLLALVSASEIVRRFENDCVEEMWWSRPVTLRLRIQNRPWHIGVRRRIG